MIHHNHIPPSDYYTGIVNRNGMITSYQNGKIHCEYGPAIVYTNMNLKFYFLYGVEYPDFDEWLAATPIDEERKIMMKLEQF